MQIKLVRALCVMLLLTQSAVYADERSGVKYPCTHDTADHQVTIGTSVLLICYFGSEPEQIGDGWVRVAGVSFQRAVSGPKSDSEFLAQADEFAPSIDYRIDQGRLVIVRYLDLYPEFKSAKFYVESISLDRSPAVYSYRLLYRPLRVSQEDAGKAVNLLQLNEQNYKRAYHSQWLDLIYQKLFLLRDYAFENPLAVARELNVLENMWWNDGEVAEVFESIRNDVTIISRLKYMQDSNQVKYQ